MTRRAYVLSDLHLGPGGPLTTFHESERLGALLHRWREQSDPFELVLAGDIFDILQAPDYTGFDPRKAGQHFASLIGHPGTAAVLAAIRTLASRADIELTVLAGNHDPELLVDEVRQAFEATIGRVGSVRWADDDPPLVPRDGARPPVWGRALSRTPSDDLARQVWVVHGDRWDPANHIDRERFRTAAKNGDAVQLPVGSHLVFEVLSKLKPDRRWVDELKPELPVVLPLLLAIAPRETIGYLQRHRGLAGRLLVSQVKGAFRRGPLFGVDAPLPPTPPEPIEAMLDKPLVAALTAELRASPTDADRLLAALEVHLERGAPPVTDADLMAAPTGVVGLLLRAWLRLHRASDRAGRVDADDAVVPASQRRLPATLGALVAGHTHAERIRADRSPPYFNSGTWVPVQTVPDGDLSAWLDRVVDQSAPPTPSPGSYVRVELGDGPPRVAVEWAPA